MQSLTDKEILSIISPRKFVNGPYNVVCKTDEWAVVTLSYDGACAN